MFFGVRDLARTLHTRSMEDREHELPVATARPRRLFGRLSALRGAMRRWFHERIGKKLHGRHGVLLLTGIFFSAMMVCMGYVADRAKHAADAIDEAQRAQHAKRLLGQPVQAPWAKPAVEQVEEPAVEPAVAPARDHVLFYVVDGER